jgi:hypothetical protein
MALELLAGQEATAVVVFLRQEVAVEGALEVAWLVKGALEDLERRAGAAAAVLEAPALQALVRHVYMLLHVAQSCASWLLLKGSMSLERKLA